MNRPLKRQLTIRLLILFLAVGLVLSAPLVASAHGGEARLELYVTQASPGAMIDLRGSGFEPDDTTTIMLVSAERQVLLGSATTDDHGDLTYAVLLPVDLVNGAYEVRVADMHHVAAVPLNIVPDSNGDEEGGQRGEDEPLLSAMPAIDRMPLRRRPQRLLRHRLQWRVKDLLPGYYFQSERSPWLAWYSR